MSSPTRKQRKSLTDELKAFTYEQSPMFAEGLIDSAKVEQHFIFLDRSPDNIRVPGHLEVDETVITIGFFATRHLLEDDKKEQFTFDVWVTATRLIHPRQLQLSEDAWEMLAHQYIEGDENLTDEEADTISEMTPLKVDEIRDEIIDGITDEGDTCEVYETVGYSFCTVEGDIENSYEKGVKVDGTGLDVHSTHDTPDYDDDFESILLPDHEVLHIAPKRHEDELPIADEIAVRLAFTDLIRGIGLDVEANENALLSHEDKLAQLLYLVECMRRKRINVA